MVSANAAAAEAEQKLAEANSIVTELQAQIESGNATIADLQAQIEDAEQALADASDQSEAEKSAYEAQIAALNSELEAEQSALAEVEAEQEQARAEFDAQLEELRAYRIERAPADGESHLSTQLGSVLVFDASGQAVDATLANGADSGNNMVFALLVDDETVYTSETVAPSESVSSIQLDVSLEPGNYDAVVVQTVYASDGTQLSAVRIPITLIVTA